MKKIFVFAAVLCAAFAVSCNKNEIAGPEELNTGEAQTVTLTCTLPDTKVAIDDDGKTTWEVDDEIYVHAGTDQHVTVKLTSADILNEGKTAKITFSGLSKYASSPYKSSYYMIYPAEAAGASHTMYYETRFNKFTEPVIGGYDDDEGHFITKNLCSVIRFKNLTGDFDSYTFEGTNGETVGYEEYQVRLALNTDDSVDYRNTWKNTYAGDGTPLTLDAVSGSVATGDTYNYIVIPGSLNLPNGFTLRFKKEGNPVKTLSTSKAFSMNEGDLVDLGDVSAKTQLKDYAPTYTVVGDESLCGSSWNKFDTNNVMTDNGYGTYSKSYNIPAGTYYFKIIKDHQYSNGEWPDDHNQEYIASKAGKLTVKFTPSTNSISFGWVEAATYTVAGATGGVSAGGEDDDVFVKTWDPEQSANDMTLQADDTFVWSKEITGVTDPLSVEFKIVKDRNWSNSWPASNATSSIPRDGTLYIYYNPTNNDVTSRFIPKITIDGNYSEWSLVGGTETPDDICKWMKAISDEDNYYIYLVSDATKRALTEEYGYGDGYYYLDFDLDNNAATGSRTEGSNGKFEAFTYIQLFKSDKTTITINDAPRVSESNGVSKSGVEVAGSVDGGLMYFEIKIPRANLPAVASGQTIRILSWRSKGGSVIEYSFNVE